MKAVLFPPVITETTFRPDIVMWSESENQVVILEFTVPRKDWTEEANDRKRAKYEDLVKDCRCQGWSIWCSPVDMGYRDFAGRCVSKVFCATEAADISSRWLWIKQNVPGTQAKA